MRDDTFSAAGGILRQLSQRGNVEPFIVMDVIRAAAAREAAGERIIHMEVGQPGTPAPRAAREAVKRLIDTDKLGYTEALGIPRLKERIARHYLDRYGVTLAPDRVVATTGSSAAFVLAFLALFDVGDRVALPSPGYPCYRHILGALGVRPVMLQTDAVSRWMPTAAQITAEAQARGLAGVLIASPANPTGSMLQPERLEDIVTACQRARVWFISDEIYHGLTYAFPAKTALALSDEVIIINSFSKYFSMTGWRIGWMVVPQALVRTIERLAQNLYISAPAIAQVAALAALDATEELEANRQVYRANHDLLLKELPQLGMGEIVPADGAFYLYIDIGRFTDDSLAFAKAMLAETGIAATPGVDFDANRGRRFLRLSYSGTTADMEAAVERLARWPRLKG
ncbi:MAG TPA: aminotransferase class I/II-fold pyridoxal phosphate-dependent enzyme [Hyphomicrobiaceae bacterium]|nr:aminotransferase class I/II-fold pyridoxal phosphate-dependent enzyme [Hyphomicrobiaceae bacterium]